MIFLIISLFSCGNDSAFKAREVYKSPNLIIKKIAEKSYIHISYKETDDFGKVTCNGLIVTDSNEAIIIDTPTNNASSKELIQWVKKRLNCSVKAIVPTHFHDDSTGGIKEFHNQNIPSYSSAKTILLAKKHKMDCPQNSFDQSSIFKVGKSSVEVKFFGEGHSIDNVVAYFSEEKILFGGCLIKALDSSKGYLGDANVQQWSSTVQKVKSNFSDVEIVIPGHGDYGDKKLLDYTIRLFQN